MDSLRVAAVEAVADQIISNDNQEYVEELAAEALDAVLDTLADRADEWQREVSGFFPTEAELVRMVAVLRGDT